MIATAKHRPATFADLHRKLGEVPLDRIRLIPAPGTATEADLLTASKPTCELIDGVLVEKAMGTRESLMAGLIFGYLWDFLKTHKLGRLFPADGMCRLRPGNVRVPDVSFITWDRMPAEDEPEEKIWSITPTLAIEVLSDSNTKAEIDQKLGDLFSSGCKLVWVINPRTQKAKVYTSAKRFKEIDETGSLDGGKVLPGFTLTLADLFAETSRRTPTE